MKDIIRYTLLFSLLIISFMAHGQENGIKYEIGISLSSSFFNYDYEPCKCVFNYYGVGPEKNIVFKGINGRYNLNEKFALQLGINHFNMIFKNDQFVIIGFSNGSEFTFVRDSSRNITVKNSFLDIPLNLIYKKEIYSNWRVDFGIGVGVLVNLSQTSTISNGMFSSTEIDRNKPSFFNSLTPEMNISIIRSFGNDWDLKFGSFLKSRKTSSFSNMFYGLNLGINYKFKKLKTT